MRDIWLPSDSPNMDPRPRIEPIREQFLHVKLGYAAAHLFDEDPETNPLPLGEGRGHFIYDGTPFVERNKDAGTVMLHGRGKETGQPLAINMMSPHLRSKIRAHLMRTHADFPATIMPLDIAAMTKNQMYMDCPSYPVGLPRLT